MGRIEECAVVCLDHADTVPMIRASLVDRDSAVRARRSAFLRPCRRHRSPPSSSFFSMVRPALHGNAIQLHPILAFHFLG